MKRAHRAALAAIIIGACAAGSAAAQPDPHWDLKLDLPSREEASERGPGGMWPGGEAPGADEAFQRFQLFDRVPHLFDLPIRAPWVEPEGPSYLLDTLPIDPRSRRARGAPTAPMTDLPIAEAAPPPGESYLPHEGQIVSEPERPQDGFQWAGPPQEVTFN